MTSGSWSHAWMELKRVCSRKRSGLRTNQHFQSKGCGLYSRDWRENSRDNKRREGSRAVWRLRASVLGCVKRSAARRRERGSWGSGILLRRAQKLGCARLRCKSEVRTQKVQSKWFFWGVCMGREGGRWSFSEAQGKRQGKECQMRTHGWGSQRHKGIRVPECRGDWSRVEGLSLALGILLAFLGNHSWEA